MFSLKVNDIEYSGFTSVKFLDSVENLCNKFDVTCALNDDDDYPIKRGDEVELFISETKSLTGFVEVLNVNAPQDNFSVKVSGRDKTKAILKSDLSPNFKVKGPISLENVMNKCLSNANLKFAITNEVEDIKDFSKREIIKAKVGGGNIWKLWTKLSEKKQVIITKDANSNLIIRRSGERKYSKKLTRKRGSSDNNIVASSGTNNDAGRRKYHYVIGQENVAVKRDVAPPNGNNLHEPKIPSIVDEQDNIDDEQLALLNEALRNSTPGSELERAIDEQIAAIFAANKIAKSKNLINYSSTSKQRIGVAVDDLSTDGISWEKTKTPSSLEDCEDIAQKKLNNTRVKSVSYTAEVVDFIADDERWESGYLVDVEDEYCDVKSEMLIRSVEYSASVSSDGEPTEKCTMSLTIPDAYSENGNASDTEKQISILGDKFSRNE